MLLERDIVLTCNSSAASLDDTVVLAKPEGHLGKCAGCQRGLCQADQHPWAWAGKEIWWCPQLALAQPSAPSSQPAWPTRRCAVSPLVPSAKAQCILSTSVKTSPQLLRLQCEGEAPRHGALCKLACCTFGALLPPAPLWLTVMAPTTPSAARPPTTSTLGPPGCLSKSSIEDAFQHLHVKNK